MGFVMLARSVFLSIAVFWLTMNVLLWRAEFGSHSTGRRAVPADLVWEKVMTSPDSSILNILHHRRKIGFCHWITSVGEAWADVGEDNLPSGPPVATRTHRLRVEGTAITPDLTNRLHFEGNLKVDDRLVWQELDARLNLRLAAWQIHSAAADQTLTLTARDEDSRFEHTFRFSDFRNPEAVLTGLLGPLAGTDWLRQAGWPTPAPGAPPLELGLKWEAGEDTLWIGHTPTRVYRLETRLLDRYRVSLVVSRVGEILRIDLPDELVLINDLLNSP
jgi:hypothetical protein